MTETTFITLGSSLEQVASLSNLWCRNELILHNMQKSQKLTKEQIIAWLKAHPEITPQEIPLEKGHFYYMNSTVRVTGKKILEYAKERNLPLPMFQEMINTIQIPGAPYLAWRQA